MPAEGSVEPVDATHRVADASCHRLARSLDVVWRAAGPTTEAVRGGQLFDELPLAGQLGIALLELSAQVDFANDIGRAMRSTGPSFAQKAITHCPDDWQTDP